MGQGCQSHEENQPSQCTTPVLDQLSCRRGKGEMFSWGLRKREPGPKNCHPESTCPVRTDATPDDINMCSARSRTTNVRTLSELPGDENQWPDLSLLGSFDRAVSSGSLAFAADAVSYGYSIGFSLLDRATTAQSGIVERRGQVTVAPLCCRNEGSEDKKMPASEHA